MAVIAQITPCSVRIESKRHAARRAVAARAATIDAPRHVLGGWTQEVAPADTQIVLDAARDPAPAASVTQLAFDPHNALLIASRTAMAGMAPGLGGELLHHQPLADQMAAGAPALLALAAVIATATLAPLIMGEQEGDERFGPFSVDAELLNGKLALAGLAACLAIEALKGSAVF